MMKATFTLLLLLITTLAFGQRVAVDSGQRALPALPGMGQKDVEYDYLLPGNWEEVESATVYTWYDADQDILYGYIFGTNTFEDKAFGQLFQTADNTYTVAGGLFWIGRRQGDAGEAVFTIWDYTDGEVGDVLASHAIAMEDINPTDDLEEALFVWFDEPLQISGDFVMGVNISGLSDFHEDDYYLANYSSVDGDGKEAGLALVQETGGWEAVLEHNVDVDIAIFPIIEIETSARIPEDMQAIRLFPNPATQLFTVEAPAVIERLEVFDMTGRRVWHDAPAQRRTQVEVGDWHRGIYLVRIHSAGQTQTHRMQVLR